MRPVKTAIDRLAPALPADQASANVAIKMPGKNWVDAWGKIVNLVGARGQLASSIMVRADLHRWRGATCVEISNSLLVRRV